MADHQLLLHHPVALSKFVSRHSSYKLLLLLRFGLQLSFLTFRLSICASLDNPRLNGYWFTALASEILFALIWLLSTSVKLFPVERETHPATLLLRYKNDSLPAVDIFVTTADPLKEPLLITMSTVLSALAVDYPVHKLACYVSDDAGSLFTFLGLKETCEFARKWVPFCKKFRVEPRSPAAYFALKTSAKTLQQLEDHRCLSEWEEMKKEYDDFKRRIDTITENCSAPEKLQLFRNDSTGQTWTANDSSQHPGLFQVLLDAEKDINGDALPYLTYISREKRRDYKHHFKAGAMNALTRVSGIMTNAPFILNLDCDMYINDSKAILHSMCFFMDPETGRQTSFVQFPQCFEGVDEDDIYGNKLRSGMEIKIKGMDGAQGPPYCGTGCFHKRAALYGRKPDIASNAVMDGGNDSVQKSAMSYECAKYKFGCSSTLISSVQTVLESSSHCTKSARWGSSIIDEAKDVLSCTYEDRTDWGKEIGWIYGSTTEDLLTGLKLHCTGWKSIYCTPPRPAFLGCAPANGHDALTLRKRWYTGLLEILFHKYSPFLTKQSPGLTLLQRVIYIWMCCIPLTCFPMLVYGALPALCLFNEKSIFPQVSDPAILQPIFLLLSIYGTSYYENALIDMGAREWWNSEQRMEAIAAVSSSLFAVFEVFLKVIGVSETTFVVTPKDQKSPDEAAQMGFIVNNSSPLFIPPTVLVVMNLAGLAVGAGRAMAQGGGWSVGELLCGFWVIFVLSPFFKGLYKKGAFGLPISTVAKSALIASFILGFSRILS